MGKLKELQLQMEENEAMELLVYWTAEGKVVLEAGENALVMHRAEAEALFVDLGHTLQKRRKDEKSPFRRQFLSFST